MRGETPRNGNGLLSRTCATNKKEVLSMPKFMRSHSVPAGAMKREQVDQMAQAAQNDATVQPYRSFLNLAEGKMFCDIEAPNQETLAAWFKKMNMPCDDITPVELEGERGTVKNA
ncbi:MAG TPA: nickel-binding protein [Isosphaeraceae bacterium]|jgi:hypothetical protein|nr:nickel-binding protein [Isosphaeraceae bacterium]